MLTGDSHMTQQRIETEPAMAGNAPHTKHTRNHPKAAVSVPLVNSTIKLSTTKHSDGDDHVFSLVRRGICKNTQFTVSAATGLRERVVQRRFWDVVRDEATKDGPDALLSYLKENVHLLPSPKQLAAAPESQRPAFRRRQMTTSKLSEGIVAPAPSALVIKSVSHTAVVFPVFSNVRNRCGSAVASVRVLSVDSEGDCESVMDVTAGSGKRRRNAVMCA